MRILYTYARALYGVWQGVYMEGVWGRVPIWGVFGHVRMWCIGVFPVVCVSDISGCACVLVVSSWCASLIWCVGVCVHVTCGGWQTMLLT